jgi:hypothetical protein
MFYKVRQYQVVLLDLYTVLQKGIALSKRVVGAKSETYPA